MWLGLDARAARVVWTVFVLAGALALVYLMRSLLVLLVFSVFFAYLIMPLVAAAQRWVPALQPRLRAIVVVYVVLFGALGLIGTAIGPTVSTEVRGLAERAPGVAQQISSGWILADMLYRVGLGDYAGHIDSTIRAHAGEILQTVQGTATAVLKWLSGAWVIVLIPIFAFFVLKDGETVVKGATALLAASGHRQRLLAIAGDLHDVLGQYMRALVILSLVTCVVWSIAFSLFRVPSPVVLAVIGGVLEAVPMLGPLVAGIIVLTVAGFTGYGHLPGLLVFVIAWRFVQDYVTSPMVMGRGIEIHPALVIFGVIAGGEIAGPIGMFLSIPVLAGLRVVWRHTGPRRKE
jgi:predicted PurR-regulated permease PerM